MNLVQTFEQLHATKKIPDLRPGDLVRISEKIKEKDKERIQVFEGTLIKKRGSGINATITVRKIAAGGVGVERIYPLFMPAIVKIEVVKRGKVRRAKLYYLRKKEAKEARLKEKELTQEELEKLQYEEKASPERGRRIEKKAEPKKEEETKAKEEKPILSKVKAP